MADEKATVYLAWNVVNWITVVLMVSLGAVLMGFVAAGLSSFKGGDE